MLNTIFGIGFGIGLGLLAVLIIMILKRSWIQRRAISKIKNQKLEYMIGSKKIDLNQEIERDLKKGKKKDQDSNPAKVISVTKKGYGKTYGYATKGRSKNARSKKSKKK
jgi:hypothetical protein